MAILRNIYLWQGLISLLFIAVMFTRQPILSGLIPPLAAVASAISNAIGVPMTDLPCTPIKVLAAIEARTQGQIVGDQA